jgi:hypothetical protein
MQYLAILPQLLKFDAPHQLREEPCIPQTALNLAELFGTLTTREGWDVLSVTPDGNAILGLFAFLAGDGSYNLIVATKATIYRAVSSTFYSTLTSLKGANAALTGTGSTSTIFAPRLDAANHGFIATNNKDQPVAWKVGDSSWTVLGNAPIARCAAAMGLGVAGNRAMFGNTFEAATRYPSRIRWSAVNDVTAYPALAYADLLVTQDSIVAIRSFAVGAVAVYKDNSQWLGNAQPGSDASAIAFNVVDRQPGPIGPQAICDGPGNTHVYLGNDGNLWQFDGMQCRMLEWLSSYNTIPLDPGSTESNCVAYDRYRQRITVTMYVVNDVSTTGLVAYNTPDSSGLVPYDQPGSDGLILLSSGGALTVIYCLLSKTFYPLQVPAQLIGCYAVLQDPGQRVLASGFGNSLVVNTDTVDSTALNTSIRCVFPVALPMMAGKDYELSGLSYYFDTYHANDLFTVSARYGDGPDSAKTVVFKTANLFGTNRLDAWGVNIRAKYVEIVFSGIATARLALHRLEIKYNLTASME